MPASRGNPRLGATLLTCQARSCPTRDLVGPLPVVLLVDDKGRNLRRRDRSGRVVAYRKLLPRQNTRKHTSSMSPSAAHQMAWPLCPRHVETDPRADARCTSASMHRCCMAPNHAATRQTPTRPRWRLVLKWHQPGSRRRPGAEACRRSASRPRLRPSWRRGIQEACHLRAGSVSRAGMHAGGHPHAAEER